MGKRQVRLESWVVASRHQLSHAALLGIGAGDFVEVKVGALHGGRFGTGFDGYGLVAPLLEIDGMFLAPTSRGRPGLGIHVGFMSPAGYRAFKPPGWSGFGGLRITQPLFGGALRLHGNFGISNGGEGDGFVRGQHVSSWLFGGVSMEARFTEEAHGVVEFFHRDPYGPYARWAAVSGGFRYWFRENIGFDAGLGLTLPYATDDRVRVFGTVGVRLSTPVRW